MLPSFLLRLAIFTVVWAYHCNAASSSQTVDDMLSAPMRGEKTVYEYTLPIWALRRSMQNCCNTRLLRALRALEAGAAVSVGVIGGSYSLPDMISHEDVWFSHVVRYLRRRYPTANITATNAAVGASNAGFAYLCLNKMLPPEADIVFMDYTPNMGSECELVEKNLYLEQLMRAVLAYPGDPTIIGLEHLLPPRPFFKSAEVTTTPLYRFYDTPYVSVATSIWRLQERNISGFAQEDIRVSHDGRPWHLNRRGHKLVADMVVFMLQTAAAMDRAGIFPAQRDPFWVDEVRGGRQQMRMLPPHPVKRPLLCIMPEQLPSYVVSSKDWVYAADDRHKRKFGYISHGNWNGTSGSSPAAAAAGGAAAQPNPELRIEWDAKLVTTGSAAGSSGSSSGVAATSGSPDAASTSTSFALMLVYLASYAHMGTANMSCSGACSCRPQTINAHISEFSLTKVRPVAVMVRPDPATGSTICQMNIVNISPTSLHDKFKVQGFMLAEMQPGMEKDIGKVTFMNHAGDLDKRTVGH